MKLTPVQQYLILGFFLFGGLVFLYYQFLLKPKNAEIERLRTTLEEKRKDLEEAKKIVAKYVEFKKRADTVQRELEWIQNRIPKVVEKPKLIEAISFLQNRSGVQLTNVTFTNTVVSKDTYSEVPVTVRISTDYKGLLNFFYQIGVSNLFMTSRDLSVLSQSDPANPGITVAAQLVISGVQAK